MLVSYCCSTHVTTVQVPVVASNRIGTEVLPGHLGPGITFYGGSFIAGQEGEVRHTMLGI
jgi:N-carbamoylputrescine amidase